jgi:hypothetical protein
MGTVAKGIEQGDAALSFVIEPSAVRAAPGLWAAFASGASRQKEASDLVVMPEDPLFSRGPISGTPSSFVGELEGVSRATVVVANGKLNEVDAFHQSGGRKGWLKALIQAPSSFNQGLRTADAVLACAYELASFPERRAIVLILGTRRDDLTVDQDESRFTPAQARAYLEQVMVPLLVWRVGDVTRETPWGSARVIGAPGDLRKALGSVRQELLNQRVLWMDGVSNPGSIHPALPSGVGIAGREPR